MNVKHAQGILFCTKNRWMHTKKKMIILKMCICMHWRGIRRRQRQVTFFSYVKKKTWSFFISFCQSNKILSTSRSQVSYSHCILHSLSSVFFSSRLFTLYSAIAFLYKRYWKYEVKLCNFQQFKTYFFFLFFPFLSHSLLFEVLII